MTKLYGNWVNCIRKNCPVYETYGECIFMDHSLGTSFPTDGKCLSPSYIEYYEHLDDLGAYQKVNGKTVIYTKLVKCLKEKCGEGRTGQCTRGYYGFNEDKQDFPADGMCLYPDYVDYNKEEDEMGVYEDTEVMEVAV